MFFFCVKQNSNVSHFCEIFHHILKYFILQTLNISMYTVCMYIIQIITNYIGTFNFRLFNGVTTTNSVIVNDLYFIFKYYNVPIHNNKLKTFFSFNKKHFYFTFNWEVRQFDLFSAIFNIKSFIDIVTSTYGTAYARQTRVSQTTSQLYR